MRRLKYYITQAALGGVAVFRQERSSDMAEIEKRARNDDVLTNEDEEDEVKNGNDGDKKSAAAGPISFGFSKTVGKSKVQNLNREATETSEEKDYLTGVEGKELKR